MTKIKIEVEAEALLALAQQNGIQTDNKTPEQITSELAGVVKAKSLEDKKFQIEKKFFECLGNGDFDAVDISNGINISVSEKPAQ